MSRCLPSVAQITKLEDFVSATSDELQERCFRLTGYVISHDLHGCWAIIVNECRRVQVYINTSLIEPFEGRLNVLYQFVGEVESGNTRSQVSKRFLKARSYRCVEGLDLVKYYRAADARSTYLQGRSSSN